MLKIARTAQAIKTRTMPAYPVLIGPTKLSNIPIILSQIRLKRTHTAVAAQRVCIIGQRINAFQQEAIASLPNQEVIDNATPRTMKTTPIM